MEPFRLPTRPRYSPLGVFYVIGLFCHIHSTSSTAFFIAVGRKSELKFLLKVIAVDYSESLIV